MLATPGGLPTDTTCWHTSQQGLVGAGSHTLREGCLGFASPPPGCPEVGLLRPSSASCSQEERTEQRIPEAWLSFYFPQLIPGSTCGRPKLSAVQPAVPPAHFSPFSFPSALPPTHPFIKSGTTKPAAEQSTRRVFLFPPPQAETRQRLPTQKGAYFHGLCSCCVLGPRARTL